MPGRERDGLGFRAAPAQEKALTYLARTVKPQCGVPWCQIVLTSWVVEGDVNRVGIQGDPQEKLFFTQASILSSTSVSIRNSSTVAALAVPCHVSYISSKRVMQPGNAA